MPVSCTERKPSQSDPRRTGKWLIWNSDDDAVNTEEKIWDLTQNINVKGVWYGCKHAVIAMRKVSPGPCVVWLFECIQKVELTCNAQNQPNPEKGLAAGGSIINVASFVAKLGAATPQLACTSRPQSLVWPIADDE